MRRLALAALLAALAASAYAHDERRPPAASILGGLVQERDVDLVFGYLREALDAAIEGREAPPPPELERRGSEIGHEIQRRGAAAARVFIDAIEKSVREGLRESPRETPRRQSLPPSTVYQRI